MKSKKRETRLPADLSFDHCIFEQSILAVITGITVEPDQMVGKYPI